MKSTFKFQLTTEQSRQVIKSLEEAESAFEDGHWGAVFCQIVRYDRKGPITVSGRFIPEMHCNQIYGAIKEMEEDL